MHEIYGTGIGPNYVRVLDAPWETWKRFAPPNTWLKAQSMVTMPNPEPGDPLIPAVSFMKPNWYEHPITIGVGLGLLVGGLSGFLVGRRKRR